ncbi:NAD(P)-dependent alcohol dehydrogenase [Hoyosella subflava]|uniref:Alcohol dehydrogenase n=1 Tax=Hoyosella subflava (strain DSM 45089 / JCM 17490 / NBRC 109087 / DQS3-9A1) TaxID=443218 RepID=F6EQD6_HOYSD|nr:NAD(P)-dependent alcohol dehydrogenase [Hoyosella subflava]AEF40621.1 Alcohol dehydrogenase [Hoyosella subflava DQS3-9A1]
MKAIKTAGLGLGTRLVVGESAPPKPGPNDVLVDVKAASVNPKDWKLNRTAAILATPILTKRLPPLFGDDLAGEVRATGANVTDFKVGDKVYGMDMRPRTASLAEQAVIDEGCIAHLPKGLDFAEAASLPLAALTALQGLRIGQAMPGSEVLIIGASGGVGTLAVQIAKALGCHVTGVCSGRNRLRVIDLGADAVIDYTEGDFRRDSGPFDLVFDVTSYETPKSCAAILKPKGYFVSTGGHARSVIAIRTSLSRRERGVIVRPLRRDLETLNEMIESGELKPIIDSRFPFAETQEAYNRSRSGRAQGKIVIMVGEVSGDDWES